MSSPIVEHLYLGELGDSLDEKDLAAKKITHIVRIDDNPEKCRKMNVEPPLVYHLVKMLDDRSESFRQYISDVNEFVHRARMGGGSVLIHCYAGISRSVSLTVAYLMTVTGLGFHDVLRVVAAARPIANPNRWFKAQLMAFEKKGLQEERTRMQTLFNLENVDQLGDTAVILERLQSAPRTLRVLTLNAWGIAVPFVGSPDRKLRMREIADYFGHGDCDMDIVALQEVWSIEDYQMIRRAVVAVLPHSIYFHSGLIGSGICIFSKWRIVNTMLHRYSLNGYPHHIHRGHWFVGKIVGLARIDLHGLKLDLYVTHLHAEYDRDSDLYLPHRIAQAFELSQFLNATSSGDVAVVVGDLNMEPEDMGMQMVLSNSKLHDAYLTRVDQWQPIGTDRKKGATCDSPYNSYTKVKKKHWPHGKRIDYVLYRANSNQRIECETCFPTMGPLPGNPDLSYSDHEAVFATLKMFPNGTTPVPKYAGVLDRALLAIENGIESASSTRWQCAFWFSVVFLLFLLTIYLEIKFEVPVFTVLVDADVSFLLDAGTLVLLSVRHDPAERGRRSAEGRQSQHDDGEEDEGKTVLTEWLIEERRCERNTECERRCRSTHFTLLGGVSCGVWRAGERLVVVCMLDWWGASEMSGSRSSSRKRQLDVQRLYFPNIHREFLTDLLKKHGDFLLRRGTDGGKVLSVNNKGNVRHIKVGEENKRVFFSGCRFESLDQMVTYYYEKGVPMGQHDVVLLNPIYNTCEVIDCSRLLFRDQLGRGNFGEVWKATLMPESVMVAVKIVAGNASAQERQDCIAEAKLMSILENENIVKMMGISFWTQKGQPRLLIVLELCNRGSLDKLLAKELLSDTVKVKAMMDAARGLEYLHKREIIHRDVASRNCLVVESQPGVFTVKVADFGLSRLAPEQYTLVTKRRLPVYSTPPDTLIERAWTTASDVWSFGIMMHEVYNKGKNPYEVHFTAEKMNLKEVMAALTSGFRLPSPAGMPKEVAQLASRCLMKAPERPSMTDLADELKNYYNSLVLP